MAYREIDLGYMVRREPSKAAWHIMAAYRQSSGSVPEAAQALGVSTRSLERWTSTLELGPKVDAIRVAAGRKPTKSPERFRKDSRAS